MYNVKHPPLSKGVWIWLREWQHEKGISDKELASAMKLNITTLSSYDISAHTLTLEKLDNLVATVGVEPVVYIFNKYVECISLLNGNTAAVDLLRPYYPQL